MFKSLSKYFTWGSHKTPGSPCIQNSLFLTTFIGLLEDVLFWKKMWLSLLFIAMLNIIFFVSVHRQINFFGFVLSLYTTILIFDAFEAWLKYKHRTTCLKKLANNSSGNKLHITTIKLKQWLGRKWSDFVFIRETNHTKAFILINIQFGILFILGKYINGYLLMYLLCMFVCLSYKIVTPVMRTFKNIQQGLESDSELEGLIPEESDVNIKLLSIEPEQNQVMDEKQSFEYWKPNDVPLEEASDSSDNSSSLVTNFSMDKMQTLQKDVETSDSSEDEYIPLRQHKEQLQSTLEVIEPENTWSNTAYNAFRNLTGAMANMMYTDKEKRKRVSSSNSSDGFEMIDKNDLN